MDGLLKEDGATSAGLRRAAGVDQAQHSARRAEVNIDADLRLAATSAIRKMLVSNALEFDLRRYFKPAMESMKAQ